MQKQLLEQISRAMSANRDTINRQDQIIDQQAQMIQDQKDMIQELKDSLTSLANTQSQEIQKLPKLFALLDETFKQNSDQQMILLKAQTDFQKQQQAWHKEQQALETYQSAYNQNQQQLLNQITRLITRQMELAEILKQYHSALPTNSQLTSGMSDLEDKLTTISSQIKTSQDEIFKAQRNLDEQLNTLNKSINA